MGVNSFAQCCSVRQVSVFRLEAQYGDVVSMRNRHSNAGFASPALEHRVTRMAGTQSYTNV